jgi:hypothetical protein
MFWRSGGTGSGGVRRREPLNEEEASPGTTVRVVCPDCGEVTVAICALEVEIGNDTAASSYSFACPTCSGRVRRETSVQVVNILFAEGVRIRVREVPQEAYEAHSGPPISWDDLLDFHISLEGEGWFDSLRES